MNPQGWENQFRLRIRFPILVSVLLNRSVLPTINIAGTFLALHCWPGTLSLVSGIYVNKNVKLDDLQVYGFDYDYTLSHYSDHLQCLIYDLAKMHLVNEVCFLSFPWVSSHHLHG